MALVPPPQGRLTLGGVIFVAGLLCPLAIPWVANSGLPVGWKAVLSGLLLLGIPELLMLVAAAVLGKSGFHFLKGLLFGFFKRHAIPKEVSRTRHRIGVALFLVPILWGWLTPYVSQQIPGYEEHRLAVGLLGDLLLLSSLFVLGGEFWEKLRALFIHRALVRFPER
ncbi:MAG: hypothetical protein E2P05_03740 [Acidobacteria bacterium]|nr:MAG: hypothetical protein E2P05_03740 [Acidobacteriota bacterium]